MGFTWWRQVNSSEGRKEPLSQRCYTFDIGLVRTHIKPVFACHQSFHKIFHLFIGQLSVSGIQ